MASLAKKRAERKGAPHIVGGILGTLLVVATCIALWEWFGWLGPLAFMLLRYTVLLVSVVTDRTTRCPTCNQWE